MYSPKKIVNIVKSITAIEIFKLNPERGKKATLGREVLDKCLLRNHSRSIWKTAMIQNYVKYQGKTYKQIHCKQL